MGVIGPVGAISYPQLGETPILGRSTGQFSIGPRSRRYPGGVDPEPAGAAPDLAVVDDEHRGLRVADTAGE